MARLWRAIFVDSEDTVPYLGTWKSRRSAKDEIKSGKDKLLPYRKVRAMKTFATALCCSFFLLGCELLDSESPPVSIPIEKLKSAPERIKIEGRDLTLQTYLWRDFMPISPPDGRPLAGVFYIIATDTQPFPSSVRAQRAFLIKESEVWETGFSSENRIPDPRRKHQLEKIVRDGPKWGPGIYVDAVVHLLDGANRSHLLRASKQLIHRTD